MLKKKIWIEKDVKKRILSKKIFFLILEKNYLK